MNTILDWNISQKGILIVIILTISLLFCSFYFSSTNGTVISSTEVVIIFNTGSLDNTYYNEAAWRGKVQAETEYGEFLTVDYVEPTSILEFATYQNSLASEGKYDLIICLGYLQAASLNESAQNFPDQKWVIIDDDTITLPNVKSITFKEHEGSFLVGVMAAMCTNTSKIGFLGGLDLYLINKFRAGYEQGAKYINPNINVIGTYMSVPPPACWNDPPTAKNIAETLYYEGIDIIYAAAGRSGKGVIEAANETGGVYAIGVDRDQDGDMPGKVLCSMVKLVETAVFNSIRDVVEGTWTSTTISLGLAENGVDISPMSHTIIFKNGNYEFHRVTKTRWEWIQEIKTMIINGRLLVSDILGVDVIVINTTSTTTTYQTINEPTFINITPFFDSFSLIILDLLLITLIGRKLNTKSRKKH